MSDETQPRISLTVESRDNETPMPPRQSANTLFRFFGKIDYLLQAIERRALVPRYYGENVEYLEIDHTTIAYPMICFCDITVHRLQSHLDVYGEYGIAFSKPWGIAHGIQPLQYINKYSVLRKDFSAAFTSAMKEEGRTDTADFLLTQMLFIKPIEGIMRRDDKDIQKNFTDECEWRFIPNVSQIDLPLIIAEEDTASSGVLNDTIETHEQCWLKFDLSDVKYIIIKTEDDFESLCSLVNRTVDDETTRLHLISKVIIWNNAREDF